MKNLKSKKAGVKIFLITQIEKRKKKIYRGARHRITLPVAGLASPPRRLAEMEREEGWGERKEKRWAEWSDRP